MTALRLEDSPITYYIDAALCREWCVWLHAAFVDHRMYAEQLRHFAGRYNLLAIDILGDGASVRTRKGDRLSDMSHWIARIFEKHGIPAAHFVGVSLGAVLIQDFANRYEDKVLSLACFGGYDINNFDIRRQQGNTAAQVKMMLQAGYRLLVGCGEKDIPMEREIVDEWSAYAHCQKAVIPNAGHCCNMDNPNDFNRCLENFRRSR